MEVRPKRAPWRYRWEIVAGWGLWWVFLLWMGSGTGWAQDTTSTSLNCSPAASVVGESTSCTATVQNTSGTADPTGTVGFSTSGTGTFGSAGSCTLDVGTPNDGISSCSVTYTPTARGTGTHTITADYQPDPGFLDSPNATFDLTVNKANTTTTITSDLPDPSVVNQQYTVEVTVTVDAPGSGTPTGTVMVDDGEGNSCTITLSGGSGNCVLTSTSQGVKTLTATYSGDADFNGSSGTKAHQVNPRATDTTVSCTSDYTPNFLDGGSAVTCTATVTDIETQGTKSAPSGTVTFSSTGSGTFSNPGSSCTLSASGPDTSQCSVDYTPAAGSDGTHTITASYGGSNVHDTSSGSTNLAVDDTPPTIAHTVGTPKYPTGCTDHPDCFVTGSTTLSVAVTDPTVNGVTSGLAACTVTVTPPSGPDQSPPCTISGSSASSSFTLDTLFPGGGDGVYTVTVDAQDNVGNAASYTFRVFRDDTAPDNYAENLGSPNFTSGGVTYVKSTTPINVTGDDGTGSGVAGCTLEIDGGGANSYTLGTGFTLPPPDGLHTYEVVCTDNLGNQSSFTQSRTVDDTPPTISDPVHTNSTCYPSDRCDAPPEIVQAGTYVKALDQSSPFVPASTFEYPSVGDGGGSGVQGCTLSGTQSDGPYTPGTDFRIASGDGSKTFALTCQDNLGNLATNTSPTLHVDDTPPQINGPFFTNTTCDPVANCGSPPEAVVAGTYVKAQTQGSPFVPATTFKYDVTDGSGSGLPGGRCSPGLTGTQQDGTYTPGTDFYVASGDGRKTFGIACDDNLGNRATNTSPEVIVDDTPPVITPSIPGSPTWPVGCQGGPPNCYVTSATTLRFAVIDPDAGADPGSGFTGPNAGCTITVTGPGPNSPSCTVLPGNNDYTLVNGGVTTDGVYLNYAEATDDLGNYARSVDLLVVLDNTPPQIGKDIPGAPTYLGGAPPGTECEGNPGTDCYVSSVTTLRVTIVDPPAGTEPGSGLAYCTIQATGQHYGNVHSPGCAEGSNDFTLPASLADDRYLIAVTVAQDNLGNTDFRDPLLDVILDNTAPTIEPPVHLNTTCWPLDRCDTPPEEVVGGTWVKARDKLPFTPTNPHLPPYPRFIPRSTFEYPNVFDPDIAPGLPGSGLLDCALSGGTTADGLYTAGTDFSFLPGDGARTFRLDCRDNLSYSVPVNTSFDQRTLNVDDTPPVATFVTAGPRYDDPTDGTIFVKTITVVTPVLTDAGVGVDLNGYTGDPQDGPPGNPPCRQNIDEDAALTMACLTPFTLPPPDRDHHFWIARPDLLGNVAESRFAFFVDDTPPAVRLITPKDHGQYLLHEEVPVKWEVTDDVSFFGPQESPFLPPGVEPRGSGIREIIATAPNGSPLDTTTVGAKIFTITAIDNLGHRTTVTVTYLVVYDFFMDPVLRESLAEGRKVGDEVSLAFRLLDAQGAWVTDAEPVISLVDPETGKTVRDFRPQNRAVLDEKTGFYTFVFSTEGLSPGEYEIRIQPGDTTTRKVRLTLRR